MIRRSGLDLAAPGDLARAIRARRLQTVRLLAPRPPLRRQGADVDADGHPTDRLARAVVARRRPSGPDRTPVFHDPSGPVRSRGDAWSSLDAASGRGRPAGQAGGPVRPGPLAETRPAAPAAAAGGGTPQRLRSAWPAARPPAQFPFDAAARRRRPDPGPTPVPGGAATRPAAVAGVEARSVAAAGFEVAGFRADHVPDGRQAGHGTTTDGPGVDTAGIGTTRVRTADLPPGVVAVPGMSVVPVPTDLAGPARPAAGPPGDDPPGARPGSRPGTAAPAWGGAAPPAAPAHRPPLRLPAAALEVVAREVHGRLAHTDRLERERNGRD